MKKVLAAFLAGASVAVAIIYLSGYEYIFKAVAINLKKVSLTPSTDDEGKFPSRDITTLHPKEWNKDTTYNTHNSF